MYQLRPYQQAASNAAVDAFNNKTKGHGLIVLGTGTGKSLVIADIANRMDSDILILQPSKEILEQNFSKLVSYGYLFCSIYSASCGSKEISKVTFATIGSIYKKPEEFARFKFCIIDECDTVDPHGGMYFDFLKKVGCKTIGLTATPYRLAVNSFGASLRFITRTRPRFFSEVLYYTQVADTMEQGYEMVKMFPTVSAIVTGQTPKAERERILQDFKSGKIRVVFNVNCLSVGFDYPELDTVVLARPTRSLRLYYQQVGRAIRPHKEKQSAWVIDLCGTYDRFGKVEDLHMRDLDGKGKWVIESNGKQLTNIILE